MMLLFFLVVLQTVISTGVACAVHNAHKGDNVVESATLGVLCALAGVIAAWPLYISILVAEEGALEEGF